jgi:hypothetical protein
MGNLIRRLRRRWLIVVVTVLTSNLRPLCWVLIIAHTAVIIISIWAYIVVVTHLILGVTDNQVKRQPMKR